MHADAYAGFEDLYRSGIIREVACMAHVRCKFVDMLRSQGTPIAQEAITWIAQLYAVEKEARGSPPDRRAELRRTLAAPIFDDLERMLAMQLITILGKSPLAAAFRYALTRMERLRPYLDHSILELDNNAAERGMRAIAIGRNGQAQRRGSPRLALRYHRPHPGLQDHKGRRSASLALEQIAVSPDGYLHSESPRPSCRENSNGAAD